MSFVSLHGVGMSRTQRAYHFKLPECNSPSPRDEALTVPFNKSVASVWENHHTGFLVRSKNPFVLMENVSAGNLLEVWDPEAESSEG